MARTTATVSFQAIELKGSLLPGSLLEQVARLNAPMQKEADYGLAKGERLRERIDAAWVRLKEIWEEYRDLRERAAQSTAGLHASVRILREVLGWPDLQPCSGWQHGESQFPITHRAFEGTVPLIVRGIAADQLDKGSSQFGQEGRRRSPHSCLQECLNADDNANWGLLLTGDRLRLLHDNPSLVKPAYLAVDLELLVEGELFDEFAVLWLLLHASRFRHPQTGSCVLDAWKEQAQEAGERVLGQLRNGVQQALEALGNGLLQHPDNEALRSQLASGALSGQELHRQLLRLVYRFLFLFTAEDRDLLFPRSLGQEDPRRRIYREGYSVGRLRELAIRRSASEGPYGDLWQTQKLVFLQLRQSSSPLGLPGLGGLFAEPQCMALEQCELANRFLLRAIRAIGWFQAGDTLTRVNYRDLNTEELGSVYEGLLELHPQLERAGGSWQLSYGGGAGSDRKTTGSYYTPDQLVQLLIVSALLPVIADRLAKASTPEEKEQALLAIRVLDPACGSGHFLLAAARRLALELACIRAGDEEPSEELRQECLREVVAHCIYGVDKNPMAVELCKVALWIEAVDPGKPLSFLDAHIQCGDSLVGVFDPKVLEQGIPDEAYKPLTGDDKPTCTSLKKENASFRKAGNKGTLQGTLNLQASPPISRSQQRLQEIEAMPETTLAEGSAKQAAYEAWEQERSSDPQTLAADLYTAAFFLPKTQASRPKVPTSEHLLLLRGGQEIPGDVELAVEQAARDFRFFHWHLRFGEVMERGGFDCVLGNPPWEMVQVDPQEWFACRNSQISIAKTSAIRSNLIGDLASSDPALFREYELAVAANNGSQGFFHTSGRFPNSSVGRLNLAYLFTEAVINIVSRDGRAGMIVPSGISTDSFTQALFRTIVESGLVSLFSFENEDFIFSNVHHSFRFGLLTLGKTKNPSFAFFLRRPDDIVRTGKIFSMSKEDFDIINPNTKNCPVFRSQQDYALAKKIYSSTPVLVNDEDPVNGNRWMTSFMLMFMMNTDSHLFRSAPSAGLCPLYEGKMIHQYDHRWATYEQDGSTRDVSESEKVDHDYKGISRHWVDRALVEEKLKSKQWNYKWLIGWRDVTSAHVLRTFIASVVPATAAGNNLPLLLTGKLDDNRLYAALLGNLNSLSLDFVARMKTGGNHLNFYIVKQLPIITPKTYTNSHLGFILSRVLELTYTAHDLKPWAEDLGYDGPPFIFDPERRSLLRAELDAFYAHLYGLNRDELRYILDPADVMGPDYPSETFRVLKNNEIRQFGEYRTQRLVLEAWDRLFGDK
ncbi:N-6 DNA methylase [Cyanobium sp. NIES-981]|uniref:Eco57I restriction-modification methylase domain-containing protein n=1 Tax=Cyanobium sp. NIES-981 TaxID=1851505 RepID=UPI0007DE058E|nr:N-6 DNA methylase [Cyanobium sp. NIES-981]SBO43110.1 Type II DNA modification enzyme [Cyanobium sp. NIES-981]